MGGAARSLVRWPERRGLARVLRAAAGLFPVAVSVGLTFLASRLLPTPSGLLVVLVQWVVLSLLATGVLLVCQSVARRLLPLATMAGLSLVFPDRVPSRMQMALRTGSTTDLDARLHRARMAGAEGDETAAAEGLLELLGDLNSHDRSTRGHAERVRALSQLIAEEMGLSEVDRELLNWSALLHDVGKLDVPAGVLNKAETLDEADWVEIHAHPDAGARLVRPLESWLGSWLSAVGEHHERWDGHGYPRGLAGEEIGLAARIVAVADAFDAMTSAVGHGERLSAHAARSELAASAGSQFDPAVVRAFLAIGVGRLRVAMGPVAWLVNLPVVGRIPITPAIGSVFGAGVGAVALVSGGAGTQADAAVEAPPAAVAEPFDEPVRAAPRDEPAPPATTPAAPGVEEPTVVTQASPERPPRAVPPLPGPDPGPPAVPMLLVAEDGRVDIDLGDTAQVAVLDGVDHGTLSDLGGGRYRYRPAPDYHGEDRFTYQRCVDGRCGTGAVRITVTPVNDAPVARADSTFGAEDGAIDVAVLGNDTDVDGDRLRVSATGAATGGSAAVLGDDKVRFTPDPDHNGVGSFAYQVNDGNGGVDTATVTITLTPVNDPPAFTGGADESVLEDAGAQSVAGWATGIAPGPGDEAAQSVAFTATAADPSLFAAQPAVSPAGTLTYTPAPDQNGSTTVTVTATDDGGTADGGDDTSAGQTFTITIGAPDDDD